MTAPHFHRFTVAVLALPDGRSWVLLEDLIFGDIVVPCGFITDFASLPAPLRVWTNPWGRHGLAAIIHDRLYWSQQTSRRVADEMFLRAMKALYVRRTQAWALYAGVRLFGWAAWRKNRQDREAGFSKVLRGTADELRAHVDQLWKESRG